MGYFQKVEKDPNAVLDYQFDWAEWLQTLETIATSTWTPPVGITMNSSSNTTTTATVWLSGGTAGLYYDIINRIVTNQGRTDERTLRVLIAQH